MHRDKFSQRVQRIRTNYRNNGDEPLVREDYAVVELLKLIMSIEYREKRARLNDTQFTIISEEIKDEQCQTESNSLRTPVARSR